MLPTAVRRPGDRPPPTAVWTATWPHDRSTRRERTGERGAPPGNGGRAREGGRHPERLRTAGVPGRVAGGGRVDGGRPGGPRGRHAAGGGGGGGGAGRGRA